MAVGTPYKVAADRALTTASTDASITTNAIAHSGDTLFVVVANRLVGSFIISTMTGPTGGTVEIIGNTSQGNHGVSIARQNLTADLASGSTITVTLTGAPSRKVVGAFAVPGLADANADVSVQSSNTTGTPTTGTTAATSMADAIAIAIFGHDTTANTDTGLPDTGYTELIDKAVGASSWTQGYAEYKILSATGTQGPVIFTPSATTTTTYVTVLAVWKGIAAGGGTTVHSLSALGVGG